MIFMERTKYNTFQSLGAVAQSIIEKTLNGADTGKFNKHPRRLGDEAHLPLIGEAGTPDTQAYSKIRDNTANSMNAIALIHSPNEISTTI